MLEIKKCNLKKLIEFLNKNEFYCFGAGNQGKRWAYFFDDLGISNMCKGYIENNASLQGQVVTGYESVFSIISLEEAISREKNGISFFITSLYYEEMLEQIKTMGAGKEIICISSCLVAKEQLNVSSYRGIVRETDEPVIPRVIHYAWFGGEMPDVLKRNIDGWHKICPDFEIKRWDETNYDISKNLYMKEAFEYKKWGFVPDFLRLDIIYNYGGIYLDTDIEIVRDLNRLRYQRCFSCCDASLTMNLGSGFGAVAGCKMIRELRDYYNGRHFVSESGKIDMTSCSTHNYHVIRKHGFLPKDELQRVNEMTIYPMIFQGADMYTKTRRITDKTYWIHYGNMSWM